MTIADSLSRFFKVLRPMQVHDYCHLETRASLSSESILLSTGGLISAIEITGLNKLVGEEELASAHKTITDIYVASIKNGHVLDWGWTQNSLETSTMLNDFFAPLKNTGAKIGLDVEAQLDSNAEALSRFVRPEHSVLYVITNPEAGHDKEQTKKAGVVANAFITQFDSLSYGQTVIGYNEDLKNKHESIISTIEVMLDIGKYDYTRVPCDEIPALIRKDCCYETQRGWKARLWGDDKVRYKSSPEDLKKQSNNLWNWTAPHLGIQTHPLDIMPAGNQGISKVGDYYVAPLIVEMAPDDGVWFHDLIKTIPVNVPFRMRIITKKNTTTMQSIAKTAASIVGFSRKYLETNWSIAQGFKYIEELERDGVDTANFAIIFTTWHKDLKTLKSNLADISTKIQTWGKTQVVAERGDPAEAVIASIPGFSQLNAMPYTLDAISEIVKLLPIARVATPFAKEGVTGLRSSQGKLWPFSPVSSQLPASIEIVLAGSGSGKSVYQNAVNRDASLRPGSEDVVRHSTLDVGPSGKGTVISIQDGLPPDRRHLAVYEKLSTTTKHAFNPFDLHIGSDFPIPTDLGFLEDLVTLLCTSRASKEPTKLMPELVKEVIEAAYKWCANPETEKLYERGANYDVDKVLDIYPETRDKGFFGYRMSWRKVSDFLFKNGHVREAKIAYRYSVPLLPELSNVATESPSIRERFSSASSGGMSLLSEFITLISSAAKNYPLLTEPTAIDFDDARYIVLDLNDVTQVEGSQQTAVMYAIGAQLTTRDFWLSPDDLMFFRPEYREYTETVINANRSQPRGATFEEFRRTKGQKQIRSMISRWMAEGRKWGVRVQVVAQLPEHIDEEMMKHATILSLLGSWNKATVTDLKALVDISATEEYALLNGLVHGPRPGEGSSMLIRYNHNRLGWCNQLVKLTKSPMELWASSTTMEDVFLRERMEDVVGDSQLANKVLSFRFKNGSGKSAVDEQKRYASINGIENHDPYAIIVEKAIQAWKLMN